MRLNGKTPSAPVVQSLPSHHPSSDRLRTRITPPTDKGISSPDSGVNSKAPKNKSDNKTPAIAFDVIDDVEMVEEEDD